MIRSGKNPALILAAAAVWAASLALLLAVSAPVHAEILGSPHDFSATGPFTKSAAFLPQGACSACHIPHRGYSYAIWSRNLDDYGTKLLNDGNPPAVPNYVLPPAIECYDCHDYHGGGNGINDIPLLASFAGGHKPQNIAFGFTRGSVGTMTEDPPAGTVPGYYENKPPFQTSPSTNLGADPNLNPSDNASLLRTGGHYFKRHDPTGTPNDAFDIGDKVPCRDCHNPHAYSDTWQAFIRTDLPISDAIVSLTSVTASEYMANSFPGGSRINSESRKICVACHAASDVGTPVQYNQISGQYAISQGSITKPTDGIAEHLFSSPVACTACHNHNSVDASCTECHGFPPSATATVPYPSKFMPVANPSDNDSHPRHFGARSGESPNTRGPYSFKCDVCHYGSYGEGATLNMHGNDHVSVVINGAWTKKGSGFDNTNYYNVTYGYTPEGGTLTGELDNTSAAHGWGGHAGANTTGWNTCRNVYCHSAGREVASMQIDCTALFPRPGWNSGPRHCNDCHGYGTDNTTDGGIRYGMPGYSSGAAGSTTANTHYPHVVSARIECSVCHALTVGGTGAGRYILSSTPTHHVDRIRDVNFDGTHASGSYDNSIGNKTCNVSCHGSGAPSWGGTLANGCFDCHIGTEATNKPQDNVGIPNPVDNNEYLWSGHGRSGSNYPGSGNAPAGFANYTTAPAACYVCHSQAALHTSRSTPERTNDPFRLGSSANGTTGGMGTWTGAWADDTDALCLGCHGTAAQRSGHDNDANGTTTRDAQTHARGITGTKYNWPVTPWKCVDCHDPHGDGKSGAERYQMLRSGINAPIDNIDTQAGSNQKSIPKRTDSNVRPIGFNSLVPGYSTTTGVYSYTNQGNGPTWGPCEVCHTQTTAYSRTKDNLSTHATRTSRCTSCHPHRSGFAPAACKGCHGPESVDNTARAPNVGTFWADKGHGKFSIGSPARSIECEDCHNTAYLTSVDHKTSGTVPNSPPLNINTYVWPGKPSGGDYDPNLNTSHLRSEYINTSPSSRADIARTFDNYCATAAGCHKLDYHRHQMAGGTPPRDVMRFGDKGTQANPKQYTWDNTWNPNDPANYPQVFYKSKSPWIDSDIRTGVGGLSDPTVSYGLCISCHDPHGTGVTETSGYTGLGYTNHMLRGNWLAPLGPSTFCNNAACHGK